MSLGHPEWHKLVLWPSIGYLTCWFAECISSIFAHYTGTTSYDNVSANTASSEPKPSKIQSGHKVVKHLILYMYIWITEWYNA